MLVPMRTGLGCGTLPRRKEVTMEEVFWAIVVYTYVVGVLAVVGVGIVRMFGGFHRHQH